MANRFTEFCKQIGQTVRRSPAETFLSLFFAVFAVLLMEEVIEDEWAVMLPLVPLLFFFSFLLGRLFGGSARPALRWVYWLSPVVIVPFFFFSGDVLGDWYSTAGYVIALILCPLGCMVVDWRRDNVLFVAGAVRLWYNLIVSKVLAWVAFGLTAAIYATLLYIFELDFDFEDKVWGYMVILFFLIAMPLVFLTLSRTARQKEESAEGPVASRFVSMLLNYVVTPALLAYTGVLFLYFVKIAVAWSLPVGGLVWMIAVYASLAVVVAAVQPLLRQRIYDWFFGQLYLWSVPALVMFWIGAGYRVSQYGLTEWRVYMLICGVLMTVGIVMFIPRVAQTVGRYLYLGLLAIGLLAVFTYVPGLRAEDLEEWSQAGREDRYGSRDDDGEEEWKKSIYLNDQVSSYDVRNYSTVVLHPAWNDDDREYSYYDRNDTLTIKNYDRVILQLDFETLLAKQLDKIGWTADSTDYQQLKNYQSELLTYDTDSIYVHFSSMRVWVVDSVPRIEDLGNTTLLLK